MMTPSPNSAAPADVVPFVAAFSVTMFLPFICRVKHRAAERQTVMRTDTLHTERTIVCDGSHSR